jgi:serine/threonine protein kinase
MLGKPLFCGNDSKHQLKLKFDCCGTPDQNDWNEAQYLREWPENKPSQSLPNRLREYFPRFTKSPAVLDLLERLLCLNPRKRITAAEALEHEWFKQEPLPNKDAGRLPGLARNELWIKKKTAEEFQQHQQQQQQMQQQQQQQKGVKRSRTDSSILATKQPNSAYAPPMKPIVASSMNSSGHRSTTNEPPRKQRRLNPSTDSNYNLTAPQKLTPNFTIVNPPHQPLTLKSTAKTQAKKMKEQPHT